MAPGAPLRLSTNNELNLTTDCRSSDRLDGQQVPTGAGTSRQQFRLSRAAGNDWLPRATFHLGPEHTLLHSGRKHDCSRVLPCLNDHTDVVVNEETRPLTEESKHERLGGTL